MDAPRKNIPDLLTPSETAERIGVKPRTLALWRQIGKGPKYVRLGDGKRARVRYPSDTLRDWIDSIRETNTGELWAG